MGESDRAQWKLPPGVTRGLWEYVQSDTIATDYDEYFAYKKLFDFDNQLLQRIFRPSGTVVDLGCGTGRALIPLVKNGLHGIAVDLSEKMLGVVREKAQRDQLHVDCVRANLVELDCLATESLDYAVCLFSTMGMVRGTDCRQQVLQHIHRFLKPGGLFVIHVHNYWFNLYDPGGPWWLLKNLWQSVWKKDIERGDKFFHYRGIPNVYLHVFTPGELRGAARDAGFAIDEWIPLHADQARPLPAPRLLQSLRASGWVVVCRKPS